MSREIMQQALAYIKDIRDHCACEGIDCEEETNLVVALEAELAKPEPIYVMGNYAGEGKVVSASFGLPKGAFEFAPYTGAGEASKIKHSLEPQPEQVPVAKHVCNLWINPKTSEYEVDRCTHPINEVIPVYTAPPRKEWVGLTDEDTANICMQGDINNWHDEQVIDAAEAKLKELNK